MNTRMATYDGAAGQELAPLDATAVVVHPLTAELVDLTNAPDEELAELLASLDEGRVRVQDAKRVVSDEAIRRMDRQASWTLRAGPYQLRTASPEPVEMFGEQRKIEYQDGLALRSALLELVDEELITAKAVDAAVETVVLYKVHKAGVRALRKLGGKVAEVIDRHAFKTERRRYVSVDRVGRP